MIKSKTNWKQLPGYMGCYIINNFGTIRSLHKRNAGQKILPRIDRAYYYTVRLSQHGVTSTKYLHRLLAETFIPNPEGKPFVNHINGFQLDNRLCNLEWATHQENIKHAYSVGLCNSISKMPVIDIMTGKSYSSIREAATDKKITYSSCKNQLNGNRPNKSSLRLAK